MPARSGDCTSERKRASRSANSAERTGAAALARRALKNTSSMLVFGLSARNRGDHRTRRGLAASAEVVILVRFDERLHLASVIFVVAVALDRARASARLDQHVGEKH